MHCIHYSTNTHFMALGMTEAFIAVSQKDTGLTCAQL